MFFPPSFYDLMDFMAFAFAFAFSFAVLLYDYFMINGFPCLRFSFSGLRPTRIPTSLR
jgi:hypothetical protein